MNSLLAALPIALAIGAICPARSLVCLMWLLFAAALITLGKWCSVQARFSSGLVHVGFYLITMASNLLGWASVSIAIIGLFMPL